MKKILSTILIFALLAISFSSCIKPNTSENNSNDNFRITKDYVIVIPDSANFTEISSAKSLAQAIKHSTGLELAIVSDSTDASELEIIIGNSDRDGVSLAQNNAGDLGYSIYTSKKKLFIYGSSERMLEIATDSFINEYVVISSTIILSSKMSVTYKDLFAKKDLTLNGVDISNYTIVYASEGSTTHYRSKVNAWVESAKYEDAANAIAQEIYLLTEKRLNVLPVSEAPESEYEILVGKVEGREEVSEFYVTYGVGYSDERYGYGLVGNKLLFSGGSPNSAYFAACDFVKVCRELRGSDFTYPLTNHKTDLIKVACIGDDATHGSTSSNINQDNYAVYLQKMLGFKYYVANYGLPDVRSADYDQQDEYALSVSFVPEVIIVMLGTNDADPSNTDWKKDTYRELYTHSVTRMVQHYRQINSNVQIYFVTPTHKALSEEWETNLSDIAESTRELATTLGEELIDVYSIGKEFEWEFPDGMHLKDDGYKDLASVIFDGLKYTIILK